VSVAANQDDELKRIVAERDDLERKFAEVEQQNSDLTNLWVASNRLHESLDRREVLAAIQEIIINLVGSEELAVFELTPDGTALELIDSFGVEAKKFGRIALGNGPIGQVAQEGRPVEGGEEGMTVCVPLMLGKNAVGAVAVFRLLPQKKELKQLDHDLFELLRAQAGLALYCTRLVQKRAQEP
jgi:nitrate/nitrite-specific signal transduction histidine kinase